MEGTHFLDSLDAGDAELIPFIPTILQDLWVLGSMPAYVIELVEKHIPITTVKNVVDLGCGKGAVLIQLSQALGLSGLGIDLLPAFVEAAQQKAVQWGVSDRVTFEVGDIREAVTHHRDIDLLIYGDDSDVLGDEQETLAALQNCIASSGWVILETTYHTLVEDERSGVPDRAEFARRAKAAGLQFIDSVLWDKDTIRSINESNTQSIRAHIGTLIEAHPDKKNLFIEYLKNQEEECRLLENEMACATILFRSDKGAA